MLPIRESPFLDVKAGDDEDDVVDAIDSGGVRWVGGCLSVPANPDAMQCYAMLCSAVLCYAARRHCPSPLMDDACPLMAG